MATVDGVIAGCCALRPLDSVDYANASQMKRLFIRPEFRRLGLGRQLVADIMELARMADYDCLLLDTLNDRETARAHYQELGFEEIPPYYFNPVEGAHYLKVKL
jgi:putative acetyltransferase